MRGVWRSLISPPRCYVELKCYQRCLSQNAKRWHADVAAARAKAINDANAAAIAETAAKHEAMERERRQRQQAQDDADRHLAELVAQGTKLLCASLVCVCIWSFEHRFMHFSGGGQRLFCVVGGSVGRGWCGDIQATNPKP